MSASAQPGRVCLFRTSQRGPSGEGRALNRGSKSGSRSCRHRRVAPTAPSRVSVRSSSSWRSAGTAVGMVGLVSITVELSNLGPLRSAELGLSDLVLLIGENNSGKTFLATVLHRVLDNTPSRPWDLSRRSADVPPLLRDWLTRVADDPDDLPLGPTSSPRASTTTAGRGRRRSRRRPCRCTARLFATRSRMRSAPRPRGCGAGPGPAMPPTATSACGVPRPPGKWRSGSTRTG